MSRPLLSSFRTIPKPSRFNTHTSCSSIPLPRLVRPAISHSTHRLFSSTRATMSSSTGLEKISTANGPPPAAPYSQAIRAASQIWVSGQLPADSSGKLIDGSMTEKTRACCENVKAILEAAGSEIGKVVRVGVFLTTMDNFKEMNEEYAKHFVHKPARTCVAVKELPLGVDIEIEAIALA